MVRFITKDGKKIPIDDNKPRRSGSGRNDKSEGMKIGSGTRVPKTTKPRIPDEIGDLTGEQRLVAEKQVDSEIIKSFEGQTGENLYEFDNGEEWYIFDSFEDAEREAIEQVRQDVENEPEIFSEGFLDDHITISETDRNIIAGEEADNQTEGLSDQLRDELIGDIESQFEDEIEKNPKKFGLTDKDVEDKSDEYTDVFDKEVDEELEKQIDEKVEQKRDELVDEIRDKLKNPIDYFVEEQGIFSKEDLLKQSFISVDEDSASKEAVSVDGVAHFLARYDGSEIEADGLFMYRTN